MNFKKEKKYKMSHKVPCHSDYNMFKIRSQSPLSLLAIGTLCYTGILGIMNFFITHSRTKPSAYLEK